MDLGTIWSRVDKDYYGSAVHDFAQDVRMSLSVCGIYRCIFNHVLGSNLSFSVTY